MTRLHPTTRHSAHRLLHHDNGAHRTTPASASGRHVDGYEHAIDAHLDAHAARQGACGIEFDHTPDGDVDPGPACAVCGKPQE